MNIIHLDDFSEVDDPVKTEDTIQQQLVDRHMEIETDYHYVRMPLAFWINTKGVFETQKIVNNVCQENKGKKLFFVCQHILVNRINFHDHLVFTPHATIFDSYLPIPHYSCNYDIKMAKEWDKRKYMFSFIGSFRTHPVRKRLYDLLKDRNDCLIIDTGSWHFESNKKTQEENSLNYIEILGNTKYSLCPRGTGPSTIRMWESMAMGSKPVVLSNYLKYPLDMFLEKQIWAKVSEECNKEHFEPEKWKNEPYDNSEYYQYFDNENLYKTIIRSI